MVQMEIFLLSRCFARIVLYVLYRQRGNLRGEGGGQQTFRRSLSFPFSPHLAEMRAPFGIPGIS